MSVVFHHSAIHGGFGFLFVKFLTETKITFLLVAGSHCLCAKNICIPCHSLLKNKAIWSNLIEAQEDNFSYFCLKLTTVLAYSTRTTSYFFN